MHCDKVAISPRRCCVGVEICCCCANVCWLIIMMFERSCCNSASNAVSTTSISRSSSRRLTIRATRASGSMSTMAMACMGTSPLARHRTSICSWLSPRLRTSLLTSGSQRATVVRVSCVSPTSSHSSAWRSASSRTLSISRGCIRLSIVTNCR